MFALFEMNGIVVIALLSLMLGVLFCILIVLALKGSRLAGDPNTSVGEDFRAEARRWREQPFQTAAKTGLLLAVFAMVMYAMWR